MKGYKNVLVVTEGGKIVGLFVDTDNNILEESNTVSASSALSSITVTGLTAPVKDATPVTSATVAHATAFVTWTPTVSGNFAASTKYTATVTVTANPGYYFLDTVSASSITVAGGTVSNVSVAAKGASVTFNVAFPATGA